MKQNNDFISNIFDIACINVVASGRREYYGILFPVEKIMFNIFGAKISTILLYKQISLIRVKPFHHNQYLYLTSVFYDGISIYF